jgi:MFS family permease
LRSDRSSTDAARRAPGPAGATFPLWALRSLVVFPGAFAEGMLAVWLPWSITQATLHTPWLGPVSAALIAAAIAGTLGAPWLHRHLGPRRMTILTALTATLCLTAAAAAALWLAGSPGLACVFALAAVATDGAADVGFSVLTPLLARLSRRPLAKFAAANWIWTIFGAALGGVFAGWGLQSQAITWLLFALITSSGIVVVGFACLVPRSRQRGGLPSAGWKAVFSGQLWKPGTVAVCLAIFALGFVFGPLDNLLVPAHLASQGRSAATFGNLIAAGGLGLAAGLAILQFTRTPTGRRWLFVVTVALIGVALYIGFIWWLPGDALLLSGVFLATVMLAPLLPMLDAAVLTSTGTEHRALLIAFVGTLSSASDMLGTATFGLVVSRVGSGVALSFCFMLACAAALAFLVSRYFRTQAG